MTWQTIRHGYPRWVVFEAYPSTPTTPSGLRLTL